MINRRSLVAGTAGLVGALSGAPARANTSCPDGNIGRRFEVFQQTNGQWRWRLWAANGNIIAEAGGDGYTSKAGCLNGIEAVRAAAQAPMCEKVV